MTFTRDINFNPDYLKAYEAVEGGELRSFRYSDPLGEGFVYFIQRPLDAFSGFAGYSDIITPYGYGGQVISPCEPEGRKRLAENFNAAFLRHCRQERIVSYFARFNPFLENASDFVDFFDELTPVRKVVVLDLTGETVEDTLSHKCVQQYRSAVNRGTTVALCDLKAELRSFIDMYYGFMDDKNAAGYYFFPETYFEYLAEAFPENACLFAAYVGGKAVQYMLVFEYGDVAYYHLTGKLEGYNYYKTSYAINVGAAQHAMERGCKYAMMGGGVSSSEDDMLYKYKKHYTDNPPLPFYVGKKVFDTEAYRELCRQAEEARGALSQGFFPAYRMPRE